MKKCELCKEKARMHCDSDQASLCWDCDAKVHSANFLVARHSRNLLCHVCQSPTPWSASGCRLGPTVSVCEQCVDQGRRDDSGEEGSEEEMEEVVEENQVVPWSPTPPADSSSSIEESVSGENGVVSRKRFRIDNQEDQSCTSSYRNICNHFPSDPAPEASRKFLKRKPMPPSKLQRTESDSLRVELCHSGILDSLKRFHREGTQQNEDVTDFCASPGTSI